MLAGCLTSHPSARTSTPSFCNSSAACRQRSFLRAQSTRFAPISASPSAICRPRPTEPPVTMATRPVRSNICLLFRVAGITAKHFHLTEKYVCVYHMLFTYASQRQLRAAMRSPLNLEGEAQAELNFTLGKRSSKPKRLARRKRCAPVHVKPGIARGTCACDRTWRPNAQQRTHLVINTRIVGVIGDVEALRRK